MPLKSVSRASQIVSVNPRREPHAARHEHKARALDGTTSFARI